MSGASSMAPGAIGTRRFRDMEEVKQVPGYRPDHPVSKTNYQYILGFYRFKEEVRCCRVNDSGQICREGHKFGYVVRLVDQSVTIVGNDCATTKFGDDAQIRSDANRMANEIERLTRIERLGELLGNKEKILRELTEAQAQVDAMRTRVHAGFEKLGPRVRSRLLEMAKTGNGAVHAIGFRRRAIETSAGDEIAVTKVPLRLGSIAAPELLCPDGFTPFLNARLRIVRAYTTASKSEKNPRSVQLRDLVGIIADYPRVLNSAAKLSGLEAGFTANDFSLLCYLDDDKQERLNAAQFACSRLGIESTKAYAKKWLEEQDFLRCSAAKVDSIRMATGSLIKASSLTF